MNDQVSGPNCTSTGSHIERGSLTWLNEKRQGLGHLEK